MGKIVVWRYDARKFQPGDVIQPDPETPPNLQPSEEKAEILVRAGHPTAELIRRQSVYCFENKAKANLGAVVQKRRLYELEVDDDDINHRGDLNHYSDLSELDDGDPDCGRLVAAYWSGQPSETNPSFEVLVSKATVIREHKPRPLSGEPEPYDPLNPDYDPEA